MRVGIVDLVTGVASITAVAVQFTYIYQTGLVVPKSIANSFERLECTLSSKGGKVAGRAFPDCFPFSYGAYCTEKQPCTPCDDGHCQQCKIDMSNANCNFKEGTGPYCLFTSKELPDLPEGTKKVLPCVKCCSDA